MFRLVTFCLHCPHIIQFLFLILPSKHIQLVSQEEERKRERERGGRGGGRSKRKLGRGERPVTGDSLTLFSKRTVEWA